MNFSYEQEEFMNSVIDDYNNNRYGMKLLNAPAGTGKTTVAKELYTMPFSNNIIFVAPTHKACGILEQSIRGVITVHKFLNAKPIYDQITGDITFKFTKKEYKKKIIIVDECSMINNEMFKLFKELSTENFIIFLGDDLQLPPIDNDNEDEHDKKKKFK